MTRNKKKETRHVPHITDVLEVLDVDTFGLQDLLDHVGPHLLLVLGVVGLPGGGVLLLVCDALHALRARVLLVHSHLKRNHRLSARAPGFQAATMSTTSSVDAKISS